MQFFNASVGVLYSKRQVFFIYRLAQTVKAMISAGILLTYALQFYIVIDIMWPSIHSTLGPFKFPILAECTFRSSLVLVTCEYLI